MSKYKKVAECPPQILELIELLKGKVPLVTIQAASSIFFSDPEYASRIQKCPICRDVFWSKKANTETCGEKNCASTLYNRKRLAREKAERSAKKAVGEITTL